MKQIKYLFTAGETKSLPAVGNYIYMKNAAGEVLVKTDRDESAFMVAGDFVRTDRPFKNLILEDLSGAGNQITLVTADDGEAGKWGNVNIVQSGSIIDIADVSVLATTNTLILAANGNRKEAFLTPSAACRIGSSSAGAARGIPVAANATLILDGTMAIYAYGAGAFTVAVAYSE